MEKDTSRTGDVGWQRVEIYPGHYIWQKPIDPEIMERMPETGSKPFIQVTLFEFVVKEIKNTIKLVRGL